MKKLIIFMACAALFFAACKKDKKDETTPDPEIPATADTAASFNISVFNQILNDTTLSAADSMAVVFFRDTHANFIAVNSVTYNGLNIPYVSTEECYISYDITSLSPSKWIVKGNSVIPDFDYTDNTIPSEYTAYKKLPSSISKTKDFTLTLDKSAFKNTNYIDVYIYDQNDNMISRDILDMNNTYVTFTSAELSVLGKDATLAVEPFNIHTETINGRTYLFSHSTHYQKPVKVN